MILAVSLLPLGMTSMLAIAKRPVDLNLKLFAILVPLQAFGAIEVGFSIPPIYLFLVCMLLGVLARGDRLNLGASGSKWLLAYIGVVIVSTAYAKFYIQPPQVELDVAMRHRGGSMRSVLQLLLTIFHLAPFFLITTAIRTRETADSVLKVYLWTGVGLALLGIYQIFAFALDLPFKDITWSINLASDSSAYHYSDIRYYSARVASFSTRATFIESRIFADYLLSVVPIAAALWLGRTRELSSRFGRLAAPFATVAGLLAIFFTFSRAGWISMAIAVFVLGLLMKPAKLVKAGVVGVLAMIVMTALFSKLGFFSDSVGSLWDVFAGRMNARDIIFDPRFTFLLVLWDLFLSHPILGVGAGNFSFFAAAALNSPLLISAHGVLWEALAEFGLAGFTCFLAAILAVMLRTWRAIRLTDSDSSKALLVGLLASFVALFANSFTGSDRPPFYFMFAMAMCAVYARLALDANRSRSI